MELEQQNCNDKEILRLNISGTIYMCYSKTLKAFPASKLANLNKQTDNYIEKTDEYFFDRNPYLFSFILDSYQKGEVHLPKDICGTTFIKELKFWNISEHFVSPCCLDALYHSEDDIKTMKALIDSVEEAGVGVTAKANLSVRKMIWRFLDEPNSSKLAQVWSAFMSILIIAAVFADSLSSLTAFQEDFTDAEMEAFGRLSGVFMVENSTLDTIKSKKTKASLNIVMTLCHSILTFEIILCFAVCENKRAFTTSLARWFAFLGYASFWGAFAIFANLERLDSYHYVNAFFVLRYFQLFKLARLFYFTKRSPAFKIMGMTFRASLEEFKILIFLLGILVVVFGYCMLAAEYFKNPDFRNAFIAMYWALITITTVGYGDYTPETAIGHVLAGACAVIGVLVLALPVGIIASSFYKFYHYYGHAEKHVQMSRDYNADEPEK